MAVVSELLAWLRGVLDERERLATAAEGGRWKMTGAPYEPCVIDEGGGAVATFTKVYPECAILLDDDVAAHIAANDPASVLAQVRADRMILDRYRQAVEAGDQITWSGGEYARVIALEDVVKLRAEAYAGCPGYREEWRP